MAALPTSPLLVGGRLRRAPAGRGVPVPPDGPATGYATPASAADLADAVAAARAALPGWSGRPVDERARVLFGVAALLDGIDDPDLDGAADRWLWYAGWADKLPGAARTAGDGVSWGVPRPVGVVGALAPPAGTALVDALAAALAAGATAVAVAPQERPRAAGLLAEVLAEADLPAGAANLLTGDLTALGPALARADVDGLDPGAEPGNDVAAAVARAAARGVRVLPAGADGGARLRAWTTTATVWHPAGG